LRVALTVMDQCVCVENISQKGIQKYT